MWKERKTRVKYFRKLSEYKQSHTEVRVKPQQAVNTRGGVTYEPRMPRSW